MRKTPRNAPCSRSGHVHATYARVHGWFVAAMDDDIARGRKELGTTLDRWSHLGFHGMHFWALYGELQYDLYEGRAEQGLARIEGARKDLKRSRILAMQFYRVFLTTTEANLCSRRRHGTRARRLARSKRSRRSSRERDRRTPRRTRR